MAGPDSFDEFVRLGAGTPQAEPSNPFAEFVRNQQQQAGQAAYGANLAAEGSNPDAAGRAAELAPGLGLPASVVESNLPQFEQQAQTAKNAKIIDGNPVLQDWLAANPEAARVARDDFDKLDVISKGWRALSSGASSAFLSDERGRLGNLVQLGSGDKALPGKISAIDKSLEASPQLSGVYGALQKSAGFAGGLLDNFLHALPQGAQGLALGATTGAAAGAAAGGVGALPGAAAGGAVGATTGFGVGFKWDMARIAAGNAYLDMGKIQGANGEAIDEAARQVGSVLVGLGTYALADVGGKVASKFMSDAVSQAVAQPTVARSMGLLAKRLAGAGVEGAAINASMEGVNIFGTELAKQLSTGDFSTVFNDPVRRQEVLDRLTYAALDGALLFPTMRLPGAALSFAGDTLRARQGQSDVALFHGLEQGAQASKLRERSLQAFQDFLSRQTNGSPVENLYIPGERVRELYQSMGVEPGEDDPILGKIAPDIADQLKQAQATGGDVVVPTAGYVSHLAGSEISEALRPDIRVRQDGMTLREAIEFDKNRGDLNADSVADLKSQMEHELNAAAPTQAVYADMFGKLRQAGYTVDTARQYATLIAARYTARAERLGGTAGAAHDLYQREGIDVKRVLPPALAHVPVDETDMLINALRNGSKLPSDKELFGPSLLDWIKGAGGMVDAGGELKAMDAHKMRGLVRKAGAGDNEFRPDSIARAAWEEGYFPEHQERPTTSDLFEAIRAELGGRKRYRLGAEDERRAAFKEAVSGLDQFLSEKGLDVETASNAEIKAALREHQAEAMGREFGQDGVTPLPMVGDRLARLRTLEAERRAEGLGEKTAGSPARSFSEIAKRPGVEFNQSERGKITLDDGRAVISLFRDADLSTFLHESGHLFLDELVRDAALPGAPEGLHEDLGKVLKWLGVDKVEDIGTEQHEKWARGFEAYLMEGKAPSTALATAFRKFKMWLTTIYRHLVNLQAPISDEIRGVMDRLLASDNEIETVRQVERLNPIFADARSALMTEAEFAAYTKGIERARNETDERMLKRTMEQIRKERTQQWRNEADAVRAEVDKQMRSRPDLRAQYWLRTGRLLDRPADEQSPVEHARLSRDELAAMYGHDEAPDLLPKGTYSNKGGVHPDEIAELFGYPSGDALVRALMSLEATRKQAQEQTGKALDGTRYLGWLVDREVEAQMRERHGDALADGSIEQEALAAVHNAAQADVMATELRFLARREQQERPPFKLEDLRRWAFGEISDMRVDRATNAAAFHRAEGKAGRDVERALLKGDTAAAFAAKQRQLVNHLLGIEAERAREDYEAGRKSFERYAGKPVLAGMDQAYLDRIHELLGRFGYEVKRSPEELRGALAGGTLEGFVNGKLGDGFEIIVPSFLYDARFAKPVEELTVDQFRGLAEAVQSLAHNGRAEKLVTVEGQRVQFEGLVAEAVDAMADLKRLKPPAEINPGTGAGVRGALERLRELMRSSNAGLMKEENVLDWLDKRDPNGVFNRVVFRRLKEAQHRENDMLAELTGRLRSLGDGFGKEWRKSLNERREIPELPDKQGTVTWRKQDVLSMALNVGNESNFDKLVRGYGWDRATVTHVLDREMTAADWQFVQGVWDTFEHLYPEIEAMTRRITGIGPDKVEALPVETRHGMFRGGYYPVVYDPLKSQNAARYGAKTAAAMFENDYFRATTPKGHTISRIQDYAAPIRLSLDIIPWKLGQAVHDLAFREAIMDADKFLGDKRIRENVDEILGKAYTANFRKWLQSVANERNIDDKGLTGLDWLVRKARMNTVEVGVAFRASTMLKHGTTALFNSFGEVGIKGMARGMAEVYGSPGRMRERWDYALERSGELRHRMNQIDRDVREGLRTIAGDTGWRAGAQRMGHYGVAMLDMGSAVPTWYGAYRKALAAGEIESDAVYAADKAVRNAHGAQGALDLAQIQRGGEVAKLFTMFYGFFNHVYNRQADTVRMAGEGVGKLKGGDYAGARRDFSMVLARSFFYLVWPAVVEAYMTRGGPNEDKDESWAGWATKAMLGEIPAGIPLLRDVAKAALDGRDYEMSPVARAVSTAVGTLFKDVPASLGLLGDKEVSTRWLQHAMETAGYVFGLPTGQAGGTAQYLWDLVEENESAPENIGEFLRGVLYGPAPKK